MSEEEEEEEVGDDSMSGPQSRPHNKKSHTLILTQIYIYHQLNKTSVYLRWFLIFLFDFFS